VILPDGRSLNQELVRSGYAWWFRKYSDDPTLEKLEAEARQRKRGLWADSRSIAPWDWRAAQRAKPDSLPGEIEIVPNGVTIVSLLPNPTGEDAGYEQITLGNSTSVVVNLSNWKLMDKAGNVFLLSGEISPQREKVDDRGDHAAKQRWRYDSNAGRGGRWKESRKLFRFAG